MNNSHTIAEVIALNPELSTNERKALHQLPPTLKALHLKYRITLQSLLNVFLESSYDRIFQQADKESHDKIAEDLFKANHFLALNKSAITRDFLTRIDIAFSQLKTSQLSEDSALTNNKLGIALSLAIARCESENSEIISTLIERLKQETGNQPVLQAILKPSMLSSFLEQSMDHVGSDQLIQNPSTQEIIATSFEQVILSTLSQVYLGFNELLNEHLIVAEKNTGTKDSGRQISQRILQKKQQSEHASTPLNVKSLSIVRNIFSQQNTFSALSQSQLLKVLNAIQDKLTQTPIPLGEIDTLKLIQQKQKSLNILGSLTDYSQELIRLIEATYKTIEKNTLLDPVIKNYLARLLIPTVKTGLLDRRFFTQSQYPLRALLSEMVAMGIGWQHTNDREQQHFSVACISSITQSILNNFVTNTEIFAVALKELRQTQSAGSAALSLLNSRLSSTHRKNASNALTLAKNSISAQLDKNSPPQIVRLFANELWEKVLTVTALHAGPQSTAWKKHCDLLSEICHLATPCLTPNEKIKRSERLGMVFSDIKKGLAASAYSAFDTAEILEALNTTFYECLKGNKASNDFKLKNIHASESPKPSNIEYAQAPMVNFNAPQSTTASNETAIESTHKDIASNYDDELLSQQVSKFSRGMAFEWLEPKQGSVRCSLAAIINQTNSYIFINRNGIKVAQLDKSAVIDAIKTGKLIVLEQNHAVFNSALEVVVSGLRRDKKL